MTFSSLAIWELHAGVNVCDFTEEDEEEWISMMFPTTPFKEEPE